MASTCCSSSRWRAQFSTHTSMHSSSICDYLSLRPRAVVQSTTCLAQRTISYSSNDGSFDESSICCSASHMSAQRNKRRSVAAAAVKRPSPELTTLTFNVEPVTVAPAAVPTSGPGWQNPALFSLAVAAIIAAILLRMRKQKPAVMEEPDPDFLDLSASADPRAYQRALARTRQAAYITKAVAFRRAGEPAKAYMELSRALNENSGSVSKDELVALYQLAIRSGEVPPQFATLLQLQEMLGLSQEEAERLELEVIQSPASFSI